MHSEMLAGMPPQQKLPPGASQGMYYPPYDPAPTTLASGFPMHHSNASLHASPKSVYNAPASPPGDSRPSLTYGEEWWDNGDYWDGTSELDGASGFGGLL